MRRLLVLAILLLAGCTSPATEGADVEPTPVTGLAPSQTEPTPDATPATPPPAPIEDAEPPAESEPAPEPEAPTERASPERAYAATMERDTPIVLEGDTVMMLYDVHFVQRAPIVLRDQATLVVQKAHLELEGDGGLLEAHDASQVVVRNAELTIACQSGAQWNFLGASSLTADLVFASGCDAHHHFFGTTSGTVRDWPGFKATACDEAEVEVEDGTVARCGA